jgi:hypothetical protein
LVPFASDERFPSAEALEDLFPNPPQSEKRRFTRWLTGVDQAHRLLHVASYDPHR